MDRENTARTAGITTEATTATYVEAARHGKNQWRRYVVGLVVILVAWLVVGAVASTLVANAIAGPAGLAAYTRQDFSVIGAILVVIPVFLAIVYGVFKRKAPTGSSKQPAVSSATPVEF